MQLSQLSPQTVQSTCKCNFSIATQEKNYTNLVWDL